MGLAEREILADLRRGLLVGPDHFRIDRGDPHKHRAEGTVDDLAHLVERQRERGLGNRLVRRSGPWRACRAGHRPSSLPSACDDLVERRAAVQRGARGFRRRPRGEDQLLDRAGLRRREASLVLLVVGAHLIVADRAFVGDVLRLQLDDRRSCGIRARHIAALRSSNQVDRTASLGCLDRLDRRFGQRDVLGRAVLAAVERDGTQEGVGRLHAVRDGFDDLAADGLLRTVAEVVLGPHADLAQHVFELLPVELSVRARGRRDPQP